MVPGLAEVVLKRRFRIGSLFSGIGGLELGLEGRWAGVNNLAGRMRSLLPDDPCQTLAPCETIRRCP